MSSPSPLQKLLILLGGNDGIPAEKWNSLSLLGRIQIYDWTKELLFLATFLVYVLTHVYGVRANRRKVDSFLKAVDPVLEDEFAQVGTSATQKLIKDSNSAYTTYASGRANIASVLIRFNLVDRHNIILQTAGLVVPSLRSFTGARDCVEITIKPMDQAAVEPFIFAVVSKFVMQKQRDDNFFLSLTRTTESPKLPQSLVFMSEHGELTETVFSGELAEAILAAEPVLEVFAITDQGVDAPETVGDVKSRPLIRLLLKYPSNATEEKAIANLLQASINLVDSLVAKKSLRAEAVRKIKATREEQIKRIEKSVDQRKKEDLELKKAEERREQAIKESKLSEKEQRKLAEKRREKEQRKLQKKNARRA